MIRENSVDAITRKAKNAARRYRLGPGGVGVATALLSAAVGNPCPYCWDVMTAETMTLDHREPRHGARSTAILRQLGRPDNLDVVCRRCNEVKGDLPAEKFRKLLDFLRTDPEMYRSVMRALRRGRRFWSGVKGRRTA